MTLARKGARRIVVDGVEYRWSVRPKPTYCQGNGWSPMTFAVEMADQPLCTLVVSLPVARPDNWLGLESGVVGPGMVARAVRVALSRGWRPAVAGSAFMLESVTTE